MNEETQMTVNNFTGASSAKRNSDWKSIKFSKANAHVFRLQVRIAKAEREGRRSRVKALQRLLTCSFYGKCVAVKRVTSSTGSKTAGVDNLLLRTEKTKDADGIRIKKTWLHTISIKTNPHSQEIRENAPALNSNNKR